MKVNYLNFKHLHPEGMELIQGWFDRAWHKRNCRDDKSFEPFILCWISFNSWAACVTSEDRDRDIIECLKADKVLSQGFKKLLARDHSFAKLAQDFRACWPIFKVQELRQLRLREKHSNDRHEVIQFYLARGAKEYAPRLLGNGPLVGADIPLEWQHMLEALYHVRCNLFHGDKRLSSEADQQIAGAAFRVLIHFFGLCLKAPDSFKQL